MSNSCDLLFPVEEILKIENKKGIVLFDLDGPHINKNENLTNKASLLEGFGQYQMQRP
jgi:hypothetical protein